MSNYANKPKLVTISQPGDYTVRICKIRDEDCTQTQAGAPKIKVLMTTQDGQKINDTFFGSTDGAIRRAYAFVATALNIVPDEKGKQPFDSTLRLPGKSAEELKANSSRSLWSERMSPSAPVSSRPSARSPSFTPSNRKHLTSD
jgi:hypothetical protein